MDGDCFDVVFMCVKVRYLMSIVKCLCDRFIDVVVCMVCVLFG